MKAHKKLAVYLAWIMVLVWMGVIYSLSAQPANHSDQLSRTVTKTIVKTVEGVSHNNDDLSISSLNQIVRKNAHFFVYLALAILVLNALRSSGVVVWWKGIATTLVICILYSISDEVHQLFVQGRGGQVRDVVIDSFGAVVGVFIFGLVDRVGKRGSQKN